MTGEGPAVGPGHRTGEGSAVAYEFAVVRAVPRVERGEFLNVGVVLYCQAHGFLGCAVHLDTGRLLALHPAADVDAVRAALAAVRAVCDADPAAGAMGRGSPRTRFGWLTAPRSTVVQPGPVHAGITTDPARRLVDLRSRLVG